MGHLFDSSDSPSSSPGMKRVRLASDHANRPRRSPRHLVLQNYYIRHMAPPQPLHHGAISERLLPSLCNYRTQSSPVSETRHVWAEVGDPQTTPRAEANDFESITAHDGRQRITYRHQTNIHSSGHSSLVEKPIQATDARPLVHAS